MARHPNARPLVAPLTSGVDAIGRTLLAFYQERLGLLVPLVLILLVLGVVLSLLASAGPLVPFIYPLF